MASHTYYEILDVPRDASTDEVRRAYRAVAKIAHPDRGGSSALFQMIQAAYEILSDPASRERYDRELTSPPRPPATPRPAPAEPEQAPTEAQTAQELRDQASWARRMQRARFAAGRASLDAKIRYYPAGTVGPDGVTPLTRAQRIAEERDAMRVCHPEWFEQRYDRRVFEALWENRDKARAN